MNCSSLSGSLWLCGLTRKIYKSLLESTWAILMDFWQLSYQMTLTVHRDKMLIFLFQLTVSVSTGMSKSHSYVSMYPPWSSFYSKRYKPEGCWPLCQWKILTQRMSAWWCRCAPDTVWLRKCVCVCVRVDVRKSMSIISARWINKEGSQTISKQANIKR